MAAFFDTVAGLRALAPALLEMPLASGLSLFSQKRVAVNFAGVTYLMV